MSKVRRKHRISIRTKTIIMILVFGLFLAGISMFYFSIVTSNKNKDRYKSMATNLSNTVALAVDKEDTEALVNDILSYYTDPKYETVRPERGEDGNPIYNDYLTDCQAISDTQEYKNIVKFLKGIKENNAETQSVYLGYVDYNKKQTIYIAYDHEESLYPVGMIDDLYEEDYPLIDDHDLGFVASIYESENEGTLVTAGAPVYKNDTDKVNKADPICYALVDISMSTVRTRQSDSIIRLFIYLLVTVVLISVIGILVVNHTLIRPVKTLQNAAKSYDVNNPEETHEVFINLKVNVNDEISDLADNMKKMESDINEKINELTRINAELVASQKVAAKMTELANKDALTGVRNKVSYNNKVEELDRLIKKNEPIKFGVAMIDLNYLKLINDEYGHDSGDSALIKLSNIICAIFAHSPVYRIGGDEFVVILQNKDYQNIDKLVAEFNAKISDLAEDDNLKLAEKVSAAIGYSKYIAKKDTCVEDVFKRADKAMYSRKHEMKNQD